jgi:hypothetical protein
MCWNTICVVRYSKFIHSIWLFVPGLNDFQFTKSNKNPLCCIFSISSSWNQAIKSSNISARTIACCWYDPILCIKSNNFWYLAYILNSDNQGGSKSNINSVSDLLETGVWIFTSRHSLGLFCVFSASLLSGISAALTQKALLFDKSRKNSSYLLSAELAVYGIVFLLVQESIKNSLTNQKVYM